MRLDLKFVYKSAGVISMLLICSIAFGQELIFQAPEKLGTSVNSAAEEMGPLMSSDGNMLFFSRAFDPMNNGGEFSGTDIWISYREGNGNWQPATNKLTNWNNKVSNAVIGVSSDNKSVYLLNSYKSKSGIAFSRNVNGEWTKPEIIDIPGLSRSDFVGYYMHPSFKVLMVSMHSKTNGVGQEDLYVITKDTLGKWSSPVNLGLTINTSGFEISPFLSADMTRLYFSSDGHAGQGDADIFVSERYGDSWTVWSKPRNIGMNINSDKFDGYFSTYGDSVYMFTSNRGDSKADIYRGKIIVKKPAVVVSSSRVYLPAAEVKTLFGPQTELSFLEGISGLTADHKKILGRIAQGLTSKKDVLCVISIVSSDRSKLEVKQARVLNILEHFKQLGLEGSRFTFGVEDTQSIMVNDREIVSLKFYK